MIQDYRSTIHLPQTDFPMKGSLPAKEPETIKKWEEKKIYQRMVSKRRGRPSFVMPDGPPYANGPIHIGHALNKILKDIILKYKNMSGYLAPFIPGWDCHGLPIEHTVMKGLGARLKEKSTEEIRELCRQEAQKWVDIQKNQFRRLGILADWENPYLTMFPSYEAEEVREFARAYKKGVVYLGTKPVYWNWVLRTALAEAEVEYHPHRSHSVYVKFEVKDVETLKRLGNPKKQTSFVIWTTTPWTLPANKGICLNEELEYSLYDSGSENLILAKGLRESFEKETGLSLKEGFTFKGRDLENGSAGHPFLDQSSLVVLGSHVTLEAGTGCVHTAPGHGVDDYRVGLKYGLPVFSPVGADGTYTNEVPEYAGVHIFKANPLIVERLRASGHLLGHKEIEHSYPHCWRSGTPLFFRATPQWFIGLDQETTQIRQKVMESLKQIQFIPAWGEARLRAMVVNRPDWCLSRQRIWGVPIPVFYHETTGEVLADESVMMKVADVMENEGGIDAFYKYPAEYFTGKKGYVHGNDILDVWFDSGVCHAAVQRRREGMEVPADIYLEGSDQHRGWFNTSLLSSMVTNGIPPFKKLVTHGFVMDSQGFKMSKSKGNSINPMEIGDKRGVEILRLWSVYEEYGQDLSCGHTELERVTETYRRIRNTMRFLLGVTSDFDPERDSVEYAHLTEIDQWALSRLFELTGKVTSAYESYSLWKVYHALNAFFTVDLSATYLDILKDRLYTWKANGRERRGSQTVLFLMTDYLVRLMAPVLSFLAEEVYSHMKVNGKEDSVFFLDFLQPPAQWNNSAVSERFSEFLNVRTDVQKELELLRANKTIGSSLEAHVKIFAEEALFENLKSFAGLREFLIVSEVSLFKGTYQVQAEKTVGYKCIRCWTYSAKIKTEADLNNGASDKTKEFIGICPKCVEVLS